MEFRIEKREAFRIVGVSVPLESDIEKNFEAVPQVWGRAMLSPARTFSPEARPHSGHFPGPH